MRREPPRIIGVCARQDAQDDAPHRRQHHIHTLHDTICQPFGRRPWVESIEAVTGPPF
jgi:hypothetical protein